MTCRPLLHVALLEFCSIPGTSPEANYVQIPDRAKVSHPGTCAQTWPLRKGTPPSSFPAILWKYQHWAQRSPLGGPPLTPQHPQQTPTEVLWRGCTGHQNSPSWGRAPQGVPSTVQTQEALKNLFRCLREKIANGNYALQLCRLKIQLLSTECLLCTKHCSRYQEYNVNKTDKSPWTRVACF